jgi:hypothetical protein
LIISAETSDYEGDCTVVTDGRTDDRSDRQKAVGSDNDCDDETSNKTERENLQDERPERFLLRGAACRRKLQRQDVSVEYFCDAFDLP